MSVLTTASVASLYDALFLNGGFTIMTCPDGSTYTLADGYVVSLTTTQHTFPPPRRSVCSRTWSVTSPAAIRTHRGWAAGWTTV